MNKQFLFRILVAIGVINSMIVIVGAINGTNAYIIAPGLRDYFDLILVFVPLALVCIAVAWWFIDKLLKTEERINYLLLAFSGILVDAVFVIGSILFATGP